MSRTHRPAAIPVPASEDEWAEIVSRPSLLDAFFTPAAIASGTTRRFVDAYTKFARCPHRNIVPVESILGEYVAALCLDCDGQLSARRAERADCFTM